MKAISFKKLLQLIFAIAVINVTIVENYKPIRKYFFKKNGKFLNHQFLSDDNEASFPTGHAASSARFSENPVIKSAIKKFNHQSVLHSEIESSDPSTFVDTFNKIVAQEKYVGNLPFRDKYLLLSRLKHHIKDLTPTELAGAVSSIGKLRLSSHSRVSNSNN